MPSLVELQVKLEYLDYSPVFQCTSAGGKWMYWWEKRSSLWRKVLLCPEQLFAVGPSSDWPVNINKLLTKAPYLRFIVCANEMHASSRACGIFIFFQTFTKLMLVWVKYTAETQSWETLRPVRETLSLFTLGWDDKPQVSLCLLPLSETLFHFLIRSFSPCIRHILVEFYRLFDQKSRLVLNNLLVRLYKRYFCVERVVCFSRGFYRWRGRVTAQGWTHRQCQEMIWDVLSFPDDDLLPNCFPLQSVLYLHNLIRPLFSSIAQMFI